MPPSTVDVQCQTSISPSVLHLNRITSYNVCYTKLLRSEAHDAFREFAERHNIPFGETQAGKSAVVCEHELNLGGIGTTGTSAANRIAKDADLVIGVGTRFTDFTTASKSLFQNPDVEFLTINVAEFDAYKLDAVSVVADAKVGLQAISAELKKDGYMSGYTTEIGQAKKEWADELVITSYSIHDTKLYEALLFE